MPENLAPTIDTARRASYIAVQHGVLNVAYIALSHAVLFGFFYSLQYTPLWAGIPLALVASWIHQRFLSEWVHEAAHYNLVPDKKWNDLLANWLLTYWHGYTIASYRTAHMRHHSADEYFASGDPDTERLGAKSKKELSRALLNDLSGYTAVKAYLFTVIPRHPERSEGSPQLINQGGSFATLRMTFSFLILIACLHLLFLTLSYLAGFTTYYIVYMLCLVTLYTVLNRIRVYGQHLAIKDDKVTADHTTASRTIDAGFFDRVFITSRLMMYHHEHHAKPALPYRALMAVSKPSNDPNAYMDSRWSLLFKFLRSLP